jgi:hypothetical protein
MISKRRLYINNIASTDSRLVQKQDKSTLHKCRKINNYPDKHGFTGAHTNDIMMEVFGLHLIWMWKNQSAFIKPCCIHQIGCMRIQLGLPDFAYIECIAQPGSAYYI